VGTRPGDLRRSVAAERDATAAQVAGLQAAFDEIVESSELVATDDEHDPEGHTIAFERQQVAALLRDARIRLAELDAALLRIDGGTYGTCGRCGAPIGEERLAALPGAELCFRCASAG
jgi:RNA polymerase-binding transcription factor DksA